MCVLWIQAVPFCEQAKAEQPQDVHKVLRQTMLILRSSKIVLKLKFTTCSRQASSSVYVTLANVALASCLRANVLVTCVTCLTCTCC